MIFITGGTLHPEGRRFLASVPNPYLEKPFDVEALRAVAGPQLSEAAVPGGSSRDDG